MSRGVEGRVGPLAAALLVAAYAAGFRHYGVYAFGEEGLLLAQAWRTAHGQTPYVDFHTGYGPLYFRLQALVLAAGGLAAIRWTLVAVHGAAAALLFALARRVAGSAMAAVAVVLAVAFFLPVSPAHGALFFVPYPAWYAGLAALATALVLADGVGPGGAAAAGVIAGLTFAVKQNAGLLLGWAAAATIVLGEAGAGGALGAAALLLLALAPPLLVAPTGVTATAWVLVPPALALCSLGRARRAPDAVILPRLAVLVAAFASVAVVVTAPALAALGPARFAREVLLLGAGFQSLYALRFPPPAALAGAVGLAGFVAFRRRGDAGLVAAGAAAIAVAALAGAREAGGALPALRLAGEQAAFACVPLALWSGLLALARRPDPRLVAPTAVAIASALQLYPRPDFEHLALVAAPMLPLAVRALGALRLPVSVVVGVPLALALAAARLAPTAVLLASPLERVTVGNVPLAVAPVGAERLHALADAVAAVDGRTGPDDAVLAFPACGAVPFFADRAPAGPHDYFYPGRPDRAEVAALVARFAERPPPVAATCSAAGTDLAAAWDAYPELTAFLATRYHVVLERAPFTVREATGR